MNQNRKRRVAPPVAVCIAKKVEKARDAPMRRRHARIGGRRERGWMRLAAHPVEGKLNTVNLVII